MEDDPKKKRRKAPEASVGGKARAQALSSAERRMIASEAAKARWSTAKATHFGELTIGTMVISCAVLNTGQRVISQRGFYAALGASTPGSRKDDNGDGNLPPFLTVANLKPFISSELAAAATVIQYRQPAPAGMRGGGGGFLLNGIDAKLLPDICDVWLKARDAGALHYKQRTIAANAEILMRGLAKVGIIALVDEATGYQAERARDELNKILQAYIAEELRKWVGLFPEEFFKQIYRLRGWTYKPGNRRGPRYVGKLINRYIYDQLPPGVPEKLRELNPIINDKGQRKHKHFQLLTEHTGEPHLDRQITVVTTLMRISQNREEFEALFFRAFPKAGDQMRIRFDYDRDEEE